MDEQDRLRAAKLEQLRDDIRQGMVSGPSQTWSAEEPMRAGPRPVRSQARVAGDATRHSPAAGSGRHHRHLVDHIAKDSLGQADRWVDKLDERFRLIATQPLISRARNELAADLRSFPLGRYVIFYAPVNDGIDVVRELHSAREVDQPLATSRRRSVEGPHCRP